MRNGNTQEIKGMGHFEQNEESCGNTYKMLKQVQPDESGRSMVEMLGVLAVIGVLSIGAIWGYNHGMNRYRTNEVLEGAYMRASTTMTQMTLGIPLNLLEFSGYDVTPGGTFKNSAMKLDNGQFAILVDGVQKETCVNTIKNIGDETPILRVTTQDDINTALTTENCRDGDNQLALIFDNNLVPQVASSGGGGQEPQISNPPSCSAYPGTSPNGTGGVAGKADDGITDCKCPENEAWDANKTKCVDNRPLNMLTSEAKSHYEWASDGVNCPSGYHWASLSEVRSDFNCSHNGKGYECDSFDFSGWLTDCLQNGAIISCESALQAVYVGGSSFFTSKARSGAYFAVCRRN